MSADTPSQDAALRRDWFRHLRTERGLSSNTLENYGRDADRYLTWLDGEGLTVTTAQVADIERFIADLRKGHEVTGGRPLAQTSAARSLSTVRSLHAFAARDRGIPDAADAVPVSQQRADLPKALTIDQVTALIEAVPVGEDARPLDLRDRALVELLYSTGARISEVLDLNVDDIDRTQDTVLLRGKGDHERVVPVGTPALAAVDAYLVRQTDATPVRVQCRGGGRGEGRAGKGESARAAAQLRHPSARRRGGHPGGPGTSRSLPCGDHTDLRQGDPGPAP
jgi:integrase/recombinase XerD